MQRLYDWTPDECIPEFYCNPRIFCSIHPSMSDLAVPPWASSPEEFIRLHRNALESPHVSSLIYHWINITFGYKMSGQAAISAKNLMLSSSDPTAPRSVGRRQLFFWPHPVRLGFSREKEQSRNELEMHMFHGFGVDNKRCIIIIFEVDDYLDEIEEASAFSDHASHLSPKYHLHQNLVQFPLHESYSENTNKADTSLLGTSKKKVLPSDVALKTGEYKQQVIFIGGLTDGLLATEEMVTCSTTDVFFIFWIWHFQLETRCTRNRATNKLSHQQISYLINKEKSEGVVLLGHSTGCQFSS